MVLNDTTSFSALRYGHIFKLNPQGPTYQPNNLPRRILYHTFLHNLYFSLGHVAMRTFHLLK